ncbi:MAG TPA: DNA gyrase subunit B, partial [Rickettsiales bacterium]|nr:DNA gyrase subunit B [Rickettsiales bacterium]
KLIKFSHLTHNLSRLAPLEVIEDLALAGAFDKDFIDNVAKKKSLIAKIEKLLKMNSEDVLWEVKISDDNEIELIKETRGVKTSYVITNADLNLPEMKLVSQLKNQIVDDFAAEVKLLKSEEEFIAAKPNQLMEIITELGKKGMTIQRFKGLGEMNAEQLWETTLDPSNRTLLQVKVEQFDEADQVFSTLMGNVVEPRRDFIQENALKVVNLDV